MTFSDFFNGFEELVAGAGVPILLSIGATVARLARYGMHSLKHLIASLSVSVFVGQVVFWGLQYFQDLGPQVTAAIVSVAAYMGGSLLDAVFFRVKREIQHGSSPIGRGSGVNEVDSDGDAQ